MRLPETFFSTWPERDRQKMWQTIYGSAGVVICVPAAYIYHSIFWTIVGFVLFATSLLTDDRFR